MVKELKQRMGYDQENETVGGKEVSSKEDIEEKQLKKEHSICVFCGGTKGVCLYRGKYICNDCYKELKSKYLNNKKS
mgnify:CR=1 FL=1